MTPANTPIAAQISNIQNTINDCLQKQPFKKNPIRIIGASKTQAESAIFEAIASGITDFGENRVQEAKSKWPAIKSENPDIRLHLIGSLQTNKVKDAVALFDVIQTLDRPKLADALKKEMAEQGKSPQILVQVNTGEEAQKSGVFPSDLGGLIAYCQKIDLPVHGLMCVPPTDELAAPHFAFLRELAERYELPELSMGMSADYETAITHGATMVRLGTVLFGERK